MGYSTEFFGSFSVSPPLTEKHITYLNAFSNTRRMKRNAEETSNRPDEVRAAVGLNVGDEGGYFVGESGFMGQNAGPDVISYNEPPRGQPGLWCHWVPSNDGAEIHWDDAEKFYFYTEWLAYLIEHFLEPWGYTVDGVVEWQGEDRDDIGKIVVENNMVSAYIGSVVYRQCKNAAE